MSFNINNDRRNDDDDDFDRDDAPRSPLRMLSMVFVVAAVGGFIALAWSAYKSGQEPINEAEIPLVSDESAPMKEKPADPGGWQFDHQDKSVYNQLAAGKGADQPVAERIMPAPEEPVTREGTTSLAPVEEVTTAPVADAPKETVAAPVQEVGVQNNTAASEVKAAQNAPDHQVVATDSVIPAAPTDALPKEDVKSVPVAAASKPVDVKKETVKTETATSGKFMAQLGAFSSQSEAEKAWDKVSKAHGSKFPTKGHKVARADLGAKGVFYRLQMGPFESEAAARKVCDYLKANKQGCFLVKG